MPMIARGELIGAVSFGGETANFPAEQMSIAREVATQLAIAVTQARLYERVKHHAEELEVRVRERTKELEAANAELDAFSYSVSHDLRAPLRAIDGYAQMLEEDHGGKLDAEGTRLLAAVRSNSQRMSQLIDDLLAFSRLGREPLRTQAGAPRRACRPGDRRNAVRERASQHRIPDGRARNGRRRPGAAQAGAREPAAQRGQVLGEEGSRRRAGRLPQRDGPAT